MRFIYAEDGATPVPTAKPRTREGHEIAWSGSPGLLNMVNFAVTNPLTGVGVNYLFYLQVGAFRAFNILTGIDQSFIPGIGVAAAKAIVSEASTRAYVAFAGNVGVGAAQGYVVDSALNADKLFQPPAILANTTLTPSEPVTAGSVTAGTHKIAVVITTRTGYTTKPGPVIAASDVFVPTSIVSSGNKTIAVSVQGNPWPTAAESIALLMTTSTNPNKYFFVPNTTFAVPGGSVSTISATIDISDEDLELEPSADSFFNLFAQSGLGTGPFNPSFTLEYRNRMVYGAGDKVYISDPFDYQSISEDQHVQVIPGQKLIYGAFAHRDGNLYLVGATGTYALSDNGDVPATWSGAQTVDHQIGTTAVLGMTRDPSSENAWMAATSGLRIFTDGSYQDRPISFWQPDWKRINWNQAVKIEIMDDVENQCVRVLVPLDAATDISNEMVFDYRRGKTPELIAYSLNSVPGRSCFAMVLSTLTNKMEIWLGPLITGNVWRRDRELFQDDAVDIADQVYETKRIIDVDKIEGVKMFHGAHFSARGNAALTLIGYAQEHQRQTEAKINSLDGSFAWQRFLRQWKMTAENESLEFSAQSGWWELSEVEAYHSQWVGQR